MEKNVINHIIEVTLFTTDILAIKRQFIYIQPDFMITMNIFSDYFIVFHPPNLV